MLVRTEMDVLDKYRTGQGV